VRSLFVKITLLNLNNMKKQLIQQQEIQHMLNVAKSMSKSTVVKQSLPPVEEVKQEESIIEENKNTNDEHILHPSGSDSSSSTTSRRSHSKNAD
jgi:hypothetical protein